MTKDCLLLRLVMEGTDGSGMGETENRLKAQCTSL